MVLAVSATGRDRAFLRIWTQKEAYLKAIGLGVGMPLREIETEPDPTRPPGLLAVSGDRDEAARWALHEARIPGAVCTVALCGPPSILEVRRFEA
jgi:4'-phosphopantetheinyl transferase